MNKSVFLLGLLILLYNPLTSQLRIIEHGEVATIDGETIQVVPGGTVDFSGTTQVWDVTLPIEDFVVDYWVVNESETETYNVVCRRIETEVFAGTRNNTCWKFCPIFPKEAGEEPDWLVNSGNDPFVEIIGPGDTITSFAEHYYPEGLDGCSQFEFRFVAEDDVDFTYTSFNVEFRHGCQIGIEELNKIEELYLFPNPSSGVVQIDLSNENEIIQLEVRNMIGEIVDSKNVQGGGLFSYETSYLTNGMYILNVMKNQQIIASSKLSIQ